MKDSSHPGSGVVRTKVIIVNIDLGIPSRTEDWRRMLQDGSRSK